MAETLAELSKRMAKLESEIARSSSCEAERSRGQLKAHKDSVRTRAGIRSGR